MPGLNQTGPVGQGPMSGRRMGRCTHFGTNVKNPTAEANEQPDEKLPEFFRGRGPGCGRGRGGFGVGRQNRFRGNS